MRRMSIDAFIAAPRGPVANLCACKACQDSGLIVIEGAPLARHGGEIWKTFVPCICPAGAAARRDYEREMGAQAV
jgi:hypothetical protein